MVVGVRVLGVGGVLGFVFIFVVVVVGFVFGVCVSDVMEMIVVE